MPITSIHSSSDLPGGWGTCCDLNMEAMSPDGELFDLKSYYIVSNLAVIPSALSLELIPDPEWERMARPQVLKSLRIQWAGISRLEMQFVDLEVAREADWGFLWARLIMWPPTGQFLTFEIELDHATIELVSRSVTVSFLSHS